MGYEDGGAYRVYIPSKQEILVSRDVTFDETSHPTAETPKKPTTRFIDIPILYEPDEEEGQEEATAPSEVQEDPAPEDAEELQPAPPPTPPAQEEPTGDSQQSLDSATLDALTYYPNLRRSTRQTAGVAPDRLGFDTASVVIQSEVGNEHVTAPNSYAEAVIGTDADKWQASMQEEIDSLNDMGTWELTKLPKGRKAIKNRWVYSVKCDERGRPQRLRSRLVAKGYSQKPGIDFKEIFASVAKYSTVRITIALAAMKRWKRFGIDIKSAFLNSDLQEELYMEQPLGFIIEGKEAYVYKLLKAMYGLKQATRAWRTMFHAFLISIGFLSANSDVNLYILKGGEDGAVIILVVYVDDVHMTGNNIAKMNSIVSQMRQKFEIRVSEDVAHFLGFVIEETEEYIKVHHQPLVEKILQLFQMEDCNPVSTPLNIGTNLGLSEEKKKGDKEWDLKKHFQQLVGCLLHLSNTSRPDISYSATMLARYMHKPTKQHWRAAKHVLRYLKGIATLGICYKKGTEATLTGYSDSNWGSEVPSRKSIGGYLFMLASGAVTWRSKQQSLVAQSSVEAELIALSFAIRECLWLQKVLYDLMEEAATKSITISEDNQGCNAVVKNELVNGRTKHIDVKVQMVMDNVRRGIVKLEYLATSEMTADIFTKSLPRVKHTMFVGHMGMRS